MIKINNVGSDKATWACIVKAELGPSATNGMQASFKAAPTTWASVAKGGKPGVQNIAQAGPKPVMEVKPISVEGLLGSIQQLKAKLKDTAKAKETGEHRLLKAEAAEHAARIETRKLKQELDDTKALAAEAAQSHAADSEKAKIALEHASQEYATLLVEVKEQRDSDEQEKHCLQAALNDKDTLLRQLAASNLKLHEREQALEAQLEETKEESARLLAETQKAHMGRESRNASFRRLGRLVYDSRAEPQEQRRVNSELNAALRALQQQQLGEALRHAKEGVKRSHTHLLATMAQLLRLRRSGAVRDASMAVLLEEFRIFQREHRLYLGEVQRLQTLREGGEAGNGGGAGDDGGGVGDDVSSGGDGISSGGGDAGGEDSGVAGGDGISSSTILTFLGSGAADAGSAGVGAVEDGGGSGADHNGSKRGRKRGGRGGAKRASGGRGDGGNGGHGGEAAVSSTTTPNSTTTHNKTTSQQAPWWGGVGLVTSLLGSMGRWLVSRR